MSNIRKRLMMGGEVPPLYPDNYKDDGWIWAYYEVTSTTEPTALVYNGNSVISYIQSDMIIDGVTVSKTQSYTFSTTGEHLVKMKATSAGLRTSVFNSIPRIKRVYFPNTITSLGESTFYSAANLTHVWLPNTITSIGNRSFESCTSLRVINIENTKITSVAGSNNYGVFHGCTSLTKISLPTTVTTIGTRAFQGCTALQKINLSDLISLTSIGGSSFNNVPMPIIWKASAAFTSITNQAFQGSGILEVDLGDAQLTTISGSNNYGSFSSCSNLRKVTLPQVLTTLAQRAFYQCYALQTVICKATTPPTISSQSLPGTSYVQHIYVPAASVETYKAASGWSSYASIIEAIPTT